METKTVKISENNYKLLWKYAGELQKELCEPVSIDKAITFLFKKGRITELAGTWKMSDEKFSEMMKNLRIGWKQWKIKSA